MFPLIRGLRTESVFLEAIGPDPKPTLAEQRLIPRVIHMSYYTHNRWESSVSYGQAVGGEKPSPRERS